jgi:hypothetical protein
MFRPLGEIGAVEAKNKLGQLLDLVEQGEDITIACHESRAWFLRDQCATATWPVQLCSACAKS